MQFRDYYLPASVLRIPSEAFIPVRDKTKIYRGSYNLATCVMLVGLNRIVKPHVEVKRGRAFESRATPICADIYGMEDEGNASRM